MGEKGNIYSRLCKVQMYKATRQAVSDMLHFWQNGYVGGLCNMAKPWDDLLKRLVAANPQHFVNWLLPGAQFESERSLELKSRTVEADILYNVVLNKKAMLLHAEMQRSSDPDMGRRLWEYNALATITSGRPVWSIVLYLRKDRKVVEPPYKLELPNDEVSHVFYYKNIKLWELPRETFKQPGLEGLLPLLPLTQDGVRGEVVEEVISGLVSTGYTDLLSIAYMLAALVFEKEGERQWLKRRFAVFQDILKESWAYQEILREGLEEGREQGREQGLEEGREQGVQALRQTLMSFMEMHFPTIAPLAKKQTDIIEDPVVLQNLIIKMFTVQTAEEAKQYLMAVASDEKKN